MESIKLQFYKVFLSYHKKKFRFQKSTKHSPIESDDGSCETLCFSSNSECSSDVKHKLPEISYCIKPRLVKTAPSKSKTSKKQNDDSRTTKVEKTEEKPSKKKRKYEYLCKGCAFFEDSKKIV